MAIFDCNARHVCHWQSVFVYVCLPRCASVCIDRCVCIWWLLQPMWLCWWWLGDNSKIKYLRARVRDLAAPSGLRERMRLMLLPALPLTVPVLQPSDDLLAASACSIAARAAPLPSLTVVHSSVPSIVTDSSVNSFFSIRLKTTPRQRLVEPVGID